MSRQNDVALGLSLAGMLAFAIGRVVHGRRVKQTRAITIEIEDRDGQEVIN